MRVDLKRIECVRACARVHLILVTMTMTYIFIRILRKEGKRLPFSPLLANVLFVPSTRKFELAPNYLAFSPHSASTFGN